MRLVFLGTGGSYPSPQRNVSAMALVKGGSTLLFDCGEGTQRQLMRSSVSFMSVDRIFVTHLHADHFLGVPGLVQSMKLNNRTRALEIYGPRGTGSVMNAFLRMGYFRPDFEVTVTDLHPGSVLRFSDHSVDAFGVEHNVPSLGYRFRERDRPGRFDKPKALEMGIPEGPLFGRLQRGQSVTVNGKTFSPDDVLGPPRKGRTVVYSGDTRPCTSLRRAAKDAHVLVHEGTFDPSMAQKALEHDHSSVDMAASLARDVGVERLFLVHISPRYDNVKPLLEAAKEIFPDTVIPNDLAEYDI